MHAIRELPLHPHRFIRAVSLMVAMAWVLPAGAQEPAIAEATPSAQSGSKFLLIPYPITEPTIGTGLLAGPVWMRPGPKAGDGPDKPEAFGAGVLWTNGGTRGFGAFDHRAWGDGAWRTTAIGAHADMRLSYPGLLLAQGEDRKFTLQVQGISLKAERTFGKGPNHLELQALASQTTPDFGLDLPVELSADRFRQDVRGLGVGWTRDTRDEIYSPAKGHRLHLGITSYGNWVGASFNATSFDARLFDYRRLSPRVVWGTRIVLQTIHGDPPFYMRPYVDLRGIPALRYPGDSVVTIEGELRLAASPAWDALVFAGSGHANADFSGVESRKTVAAVGVGLRYRARKYFGLTFGIDLAQGPEGTATYLQVGNAWSK